MDKITNILKNPYALCLIIIVGFAIWMLFFDSNSYLYHQRLNQEIKDIEDWNAYHIQKTKEDSIMIEKLKDSAGLERYARERYLMRKENEEVFVIEFDTVK